MASSTTKFLWNSLPGHDGGGRVSASSQQWQLPTLSEKQLTKHPTSVRQSITTHPWRLFSSQQTTREKHKSITTSVCQPLYLNHGRKNTVKVWTMWFSWPPADEGHICNKQFHAIEMCSGAKLTKSNIPIFTTHYYMYQSLESRFSIWEKNVSLTLIQLLKPPKTKCSSMNF